MASDNEASCESDPNFAVICAFMEKFGTTCGLATIDFLELQEMLENTQEVPQELIDLHIKLLRKSRKTVSNERWEKAVIKFCHTFCVQDAWEIERFGYKKARLSSKLRVLKELLEMQFDYNARFKAEINKMSAEELRSQPLGKDKHGHAYWFQNDNNCQIRVYKEDPDEETWTLVAKDKDGLVALINELSGDADSKAINESAINEEDSNSLVEKPIIDTGQVDSSSSSDSNNKKSTDESDNSNQSKKEEENISPAAEQENESDEEDEEEVEEVEEENEKKRPRATDNNDADDVEEKEAKRPKLEEPPTVGEAIEEPVMLVKGSGSGAENQCENPIVGEEIEEDLMYFYGDGDGVQCETGNEKRETKKSEETLTSSAAGDGDDKNASRGAGAGIGSGGVDSENHVSINVQKKNCVDDAPPRKVPTSPVKSPFKLGTIIDTKTDNKFFSATRSSPTTKKASRWDVETIIAKEPPVPEPEPEPEEETTPKKSMFFFGPGCLQFKANVSPSSATVGFGQQVPQTDDDDKVDSEETAAGAGGEEVVSASKKEEEEEEVMNDVGYRIGVEEGKESVETSECVQSSSEVVGPSSNDEEVSDAKDEGALLVDQQTPLESRIEDKLEDIDESTDITKASRSDVDVKQETLQETEQHTVPEEEPIEVKEVEERKEEETTKIVEEEEVQERVQEKENIEVTCNKSIVEEEKEQEEENSKKEEDEEVACVDQKEEPVIDTTKSVSEEKEDLSKTVTKDKNENTSAESPVKEKELEEKKSGVEEKEDKKIEESLVRLVEKIEDNNVEPKEEENISTESLVKEEEEKRKGNIEPEEKESVESTNEEEKKIELEVTTTISDVEEQIITQNTEICDVNIEEQYKKIPEVTVALVEYEEKIEPQPVPESKETEATDDSHLNSKKEEKQVPVIEEECVKKHSSLLGGGEETEIEETRKESIDSKNIEENKPKEESRNLEDDDGPPVLEKMVPCDVPEEKLPPKEETKDNQSGQQQQTEEKLNCSAAKEKRSSETKEETVIVSSVKPESEETKPELPSPPAEETRKIGKNKKEEKTAAIPKPPLLTEETVETAEIPKKKNKETPKESTTTTTTTTTKSGRGRKNNISDQPKIFTRRTTRSSKSDESKTAEEKPSSEVKNPSTLVKEEKKPDSPPSKQEDSPAQVQPRRGRSRGMVKAGKEEAPETDNNSKKMKLSEEVHEVVEVTTVKPTRMTRNKLKDNNAARPEKVVVEEVKEVKAAVVLPEVVTVEGSNSNEVVHIPDKDPLAIAEEESPPSAGAVETKEKAPMSLANFSLDFHESSVPTPPLTRSGLRKRGRESPPNAEEVEETAGKRLKRGKRNIDVKLRKSIEEQKKQELISSDDDKQQQQSEEVKNSKKKSVGNGGNGGGGGGGKQKKVEQVKSEETVVISSDAEAEEKKETEPVQKKSKTYNKNKRLLTNLGINPDQPLDFEEGTPVGVRQSRRIAQLKIKEEAERRKLEEEMAQEHHHHQKKKKKSKKSEDKDYKVKKSKNDDEDDDDDAQEEDSLDSKKRKKKKKKKKHRKLFDEFNPWRSSSDSSSTTDDEEEDDEIGEEEDDEVLQYVSDHEFSPESDLEADGEAQPLKRARTARKESDVEEVDDCPCQKCGKSDHPEWILLCDRCDNGWHCSCLRPPLLVIPEGDWFCPPCQHATLLQRLKEKLKDYDKKLSKKEIEDRRKQRLAYVGISLNSVLPAKEGELVKKRRRAKKNDDDDDADDEEDEVGDEDDEEESEDSDSGSSSESGSESDEPIYQLRQRRQAHSYRFNDYDELINSAIQEEMEAVKGAGNQGRGKDIATIVNAEKQEEERKKETTENGGAAEAAAATDVPEPLPPVVPLNDKDKEAKPLYSDDEPVRGVKKKIIGRKKHRKLNSLDISSADDDEDSDEDFKGTSTESDDDFDEDLGTEDSDDLDGGRGGRRKNTDPVRRSTRARTSRYDADFIDDGDTEDDDDAPRRKKKRSIWDDSESEESDRSWGRRKRKPPSKKKNANASASAKKKKSKKKKKKDDDSDAEVYKKKKPKIKFGLDGEDEGPGRRTRGKKINYVDALGSDSEEERINKRPPPRIESEEEYVANEEEELDEDDKVTDEEESAEENKQPPAVVAAADNIQIQSYADARFTQLLPEGVPTPKDIIYSNSQAIRDDDGEDEPNPIDQINRNVEMMDENEMEKMMEEEEYANKQLQMVAMQLEKEKRRKEREAKKLEELMVAQPQQQQQQQLQELKKKVATRKAPPPVKGQFQFGGGQIQEPIVGNVNSLIVNSENNDELSEPPGVSLPLFAELGGPGGGGNIEDSVKKRRGRAKKSLEEAVASLGSVRQQQDPSYMAMAANNNKNLPTDLSSTQQDTNIEIAAPPQPFSQSQPTPSVITRMLQSKPGQPGYPVGAIRPKQFATMPEREDELPPTSAPPASHHSMSPVPAHHGQYIQGSPMRPQLSAPAYRQLPPAMNHYPRVSGAPPPPPSHQIRNPVQQQQQQQPPPPQSLPPSHLYHTHRPMDPSPSGGGAITMTDHHSNSPSRVVSPASSSPGGGNSSKTDTPPPPYSRPPPVGRFPMINTTSVAGPRHIPMVAPPQHLQQQPSSRPNLSPYHPSMPPSYHYGQFGGQPLGGGEEALPPTVYQNSPYSDQQFGGSGEGQVNVVSENSNSKSFDEESGGEFGGLVSYFSSQREDDLES